MDNPTPQSPTPPASQASYPEPPRLPGESGSPPLPEAGASGKAAAPAANAQPASDATTDHTGRTSPPATSTGQQAATAELTLSQQLEQFRKKLSDKEPTLQSFESDKTDIDDLTARVALLQQAIDAQTALSDSYLKFYRSIEQYRSEVACSIPTLRAQITLSDKQKACVQAAITAVDSQIEQIRSLRQKQDEWVTTYREQQKVNDARLADAKEKQAFIATGMQSLVTSQQDALKALTALADPSANQCEAWFYLGEMEALLKSARVAGSSDACYAESINLATFADCWTPEHYLRAYQYWIVKLNEAENAQKVGLVRLTGAVEYAAELAKRANDAIAKRQESILKELKTQNCCSQAPTLP